MSKRHKTDYPGVFYRTAKRIGKKGTEKVYYAVYKKDGKLHEEKCGRQYADNMTPSKAATIRGRLIEGKRLPRKIIKAREEALKAAEADKWTIERLWSEYKKQKPYLKGMKTYESCYNLHIEPYFAKKEPHNILPLDIHRIKNKLLKKRSPQTVQHVLEQLRRIINFGVNNRLCEGLKFKIEMPKVDNIVTEDLTPEQLKKLLEAIDKDDHPNAGNMMLMALYTGMRRGELFKLKWKDIIFERAFINIVDPKGGPSQKIPLNDAAKAVLGSHIKTRSPYVFPGRGGRQLVNIGKAVNKIKKAAGLPKDFRPLHGLRHVYASALASSGKVDLYVLQKLLTHKDSTMTQRYAHLRDEALKRASDLAGDLFNEASEKTKKQDV
ncbi:MAG: site-specific integrase [Deltaproteobacteria bacterium]|nr:site-specific integrase [Deltaproteobacteria bacterium]